MGAQGLSSYYNQYHSRQQMSFIRFLLYGWFLGIIGVVIFYPAYLFAVPYFAFYTMSFKDGRRTAQNWRSVNVRRCFGATIDAEEREKIRKLFLEKN